MEAFTDITNKIVLLLKKTKDSLLLDVEKEFAGVRRAIENLDTSYDDKVSLMTNLDQGLDAGYKVIDAVFGRIGFDISHCNEVNELSGLISKTLKLTDSLVDSFSDLSKEGADYMAIMKALFNTGKDIFQLIKDFQDVETDKIIKELEGAGEQFADGVDVGDLAKKLVEHVIITILKNGQEVFKDEIKYVKMQANALYKDFTGNVAELKKNIESEVNKLEKELGGTVDQAKALAQNLFEESVKEMESIYDQLSKEVKDTLASAGFNQDLYEKVSSTLSKIYAVLDFMGIVGQKEVALKLPSGFTNMLKTAQNEVESTISKAVSTVGDGVTKVKGLAKEATDEMASNIGAGLKATADFLGVSPFGLESLQEELSLLSGAVPSTSGAASTIGSAGSSASGAVSGFIANLENFSYPITITTFKWGRIKRMFRSPISYFKQIYPIDTIEDAQNLITKVLEIARLFYPGIPDFNSLRSMLESLLETLTEKVLTAVDEVRSELWKQVKPVVMTIRKVLDLLKEMYKEISAQISKILSDIKKEIKEADIIDKVLDQVQALYKELSKGTLPKPLKNIYEDYLKPSILDAIEKSQAPDPEKVAENIKSTAETQFTNWAAGVYSNLNNFFSKDKWEQRIDNVIVQLEATLKEDTAAVRGLLSGAMQTSISGEWGNKIDAAFSELDVTQYINIVSSAIDDVSLPRPQLYYDGFCQCMETVVDAALKQADRYDSDHVKEFAKDVAEGVWDRIVAKIFKPVIKQIKKMIIEAIRKVIREFLKALLDAIPVKELADKLPTLAQLRQIYDIYDAAKKENAEQAIKSGYQFLKDNVPVTIPIDPKWAVWVCNIVKRSVDFATSDQGFMDYGNLAYGLYKDIPEEAKQYIEDVLPSIPDNEFTREFSDFIKTCDYKSDLENDFVAVTLLNISTDKGKEAKKKGKVDFNASAFLQICMFAAEEEKESKEEGSDKEEEEKETEVSLYCIVLLKGDVGLTFDIGSNHTMSLKVSGGVGGAQVKDVDDDTKNKLAQGCGLKLKKDWDMDFLFNEQVLQAMFLMQFERKNSGGDNAWQLFDAKYMSMEIGNYPQTFYLGFSDSHPDLEDKYGIKKEQSEEKPDNTLQVGYAGAIQDALVKLKLNDVAFIKEVLKDDIELKFSTYLWYDLVKGFDFGGDVSLHLEYDLNHKKLGPVTIDSFSFDAGIPKGESGKLALSLGTTFQVDFCGALVVAIENLGIGFKLNFLDKDGNFGDLDLDASLKYPSGFGITIDASVVKGGGSISIDDETGEFFGLLSLSVMKKIGVSALLLCDPGTAPGHFFSLVTLISASFSPGIPLGMGFSLTAIGGALGLNRQIDRNAIQESVRAGTLGQVFFINDPDNHLADMKSSVVAIFPAKNNQFFFGLLGQISFAPVITCDFGLLVQLPSPTEFIIVGALKVDAAAGLVRINVYFGGGINFEEGMWFDASIVDSQIVGISISGDMAFRLNWGGTKGFLLSIGGFHPEYRPDEGLHVGKMNRLAMKLDYSILKISFETYLAVTSNSFQIGADFRVSVGWDKFGIKGSTGFDALFQFDPFLFKFNARAEVSVVCGSCTLLSISLKLDAQGPAPWKIAGEANFTFLLIPVEVSFSLSWGKDSPSLPDKLVEVMPLLLEEWNNDLNWTSFSGEAADENQVTLFDFEKAIEVELEDLGGLDELMKDEDVEEEGKEKEKKTMKKLVVAPEASISFNQSGIPLYTPELMEKMEICNDAVPSDFDSIDIASVNEYKPGKYIILEQNDFAPSLYKNLGLEEKLEIESYQKYNSGFTYNTNDLENFSNISTQVNRQVYEEWKPLNNADAITSDKPVDTSVYSSQPVNNRKDMVAFERFYDGELYGFTGNNE